MKSDPENPTTDPDNRPPTSEVTEAFDQAFMRQALRLALKAVGRTHPNPLVGALVVRDGRIIGRGWHRGVGTDHAETMALAAAGEAARGATIYVTLEPCAHFVGLNGQPRLPCAERCVRAGVARVVCAIADPDVRVNGNGFAHLRAAGIEVSVGTEEAAARTLNLPFLRHRTLGLPFILHKAAMTLDGKIAAPDGSARWITGGRSRRYVHRLRNRVDAIVVGIGTILTDDPSLTVRLPSGNGRDPLRVIMDSRLRTPVGARVVRPGTLFLTTEETDSPKGRRLVEAGAEVRTVPADDNGRVDVVRAMELVAARGCLAVLLESGGELAAAFHRAKLINRVIYFIAPKLIGGAGPTPIDGTGLAAGMAEAFVTGSLRVRRFGEDIAITADVGDIVYRK
ncbi:MAG: bifunctional diaminohydroxyphosphoribosylaminopyrimidine deaminase/5-amino-6-(5-phosphoribosylamino)uracil reductase RibD [Capsulimonadales bacterium]|nr:bifunctional diaminohydroxyphosphoribosylaminopyrimidine deaminase/5-amino-6-(5-phosphoribosylamino)uracil reductase RibD [Capsulimonadales bacterium]